MFIESLKSTPRPTLRQREMHEIFFLSASLRIQQADSATQDEFWRRWTTYYFEHHSDEIYFACDDATDRTMGYLTGCRNSLLASAELSLSIKSYRHFEDLFAAYPAHLHINLHPDFRGRGAGTALLQHYLNDLKRQKVTGAHIVTREGERNIAF